MAMLSQLQVVLRLVVVDLVVHNEGRAAPPAATRLTGLTALRNEWRYDAMTGVVLRALSPPPPTHSKYLLIVSTVAKNLSLGSTGAEEPAKNLRLSSRALSS